MTGLKLYISNRLEILVDSLAEVLQTPLSSPLDEEIIVVQSRGMERWISMMLASRLGLWANCRYPFPNALVEEVFRTLLPDIPEQSAFDPKTTTWRIMKLLPSLLARTEFASLRTYLGDGVGDLKRLQLSERIADSFDQYVTFRPGMIFQWEQGKGRHWQAVLWRELVKTATTMHRAALATAFLDALASPGPEIQNLPERLSIFGISALPRFHVEILAGLSRFTRVNLFLMNPCREYWGDILSDRAMRGVLDREGKGIGRQEELHLEKGNALLASMGILGRDFFNLINEFSSEEVSFFQEPDEGTLLSWLQSDILNLRNKGEGSEGKKTIGADDRSIQIQSCHSPMREVEVLRDHLLSIFEHDPSLLPKDILIMTPHIERYAPYIQAAFDVPVNDSQRIPFTVADRTVSKESELVKTFLGVLDLCGSRFGASEVCSLLESSPVRRKFELTEGDLDHILTWVKETRIRWGIDGRTRAAAGVTPYEENTWKAGLTRLLLGHAMCGGNERMFNGILPYDQIEGEQTLVLGKFAEFADQLFRYVSSLESPRTLTAWAEVLSDLLGRFFMPDEETEGEMQLLRQTLQELGNRETLSGFEDKVDLTLITWYVRSTLKQKGFGAGFISGGVTFCALVPMRSIPFRFVGLLGMNYDDYPRQSRSVGFDLLAKYPRSGDRSRRNDDRYLFLEALLSARERLYISYVGQDIQDNSPLPPSVLVSELMDYIEQGYSIPGNRIEDHVVTRHRLHAFSPEYFKESTKLFSYSEENYRVAHSVLTSRKPLRPFIAKGLSPAGVEWKTIDVDTFCAFWENPCKFLVTKRLGIYLRGKDTGVEDSEPFDLSPLETYQLGKMMVERRLSGSDLQSLFSVAKAQGRLPHGNVGKCTYEALSNDIEKFIDQTKLHCWGGGSEHLVIDLPLSDFRLRGTITGVFPERLVRYRYARARPKDHLQLWISHLVLGTMDQADSPRTSVLVALHPRSRQPYMWELSPVKDSREILTALLEAFWEGLMKPLHFFPESSWEYAQTVLEKDRSWEYALVKARNVWNGNEFRDGEGDDPYCHLCFKGTDPLDEEFQLISEKVLGRLLSNQEEKGL